MAEISDERLEVMIGLLAQLVAATAQKDPVFALADAGMPASDIARVVGMNKDAVRMRIKRRKDSGDER